jgi:hypothetical protein
LWRTRVYRSPDDKWLDSPIPACRNGRWVVPDKPDLVAPWTPQPAQLSGLPTDPDAMFKYLYRVSSEDWEVGLSADQLAVARVGDVVAGSLASPAVLTAVYRAAERIPGVMVAADMVDVTGRHGVALVRTADHIRTELIFDRTTYAYLGSNTVVAEAYSVEYEGTVYDHQRGDVIERSAILRVAVVDRPGQLP